MVINAGLAIGLSQTYGYLAAAIGTTTAGWAMLLLLWNGTRKLGDAAKMDTRLRRVLPRIIAASALMGIVLWALAWVLADWLVTPQLRYVALSILIVGGGAVYGAFILGFGAMTMAELRGFLRRS